MFLNSFRLHSNSLFIFIVLNIDCFSFKIRLFRKGKKKIRKKEVKL